jgi:hypothetical protein
MNSPLNQKRKLSGRVKMLLVLLACAAPVIASYFMYYVVRPEGRTNYGALISPQIVLPADAALGFTNLQGERVAAADVRGNWLLIAVHAGACDAACTEKLYWMRQLRTTQGREKERIDRVLIFSGAEQGPALDTLVQREYAGSFYLRAAPEKLQAWFGSSTPQEQLVLMDPQGNLVMRWPAKISVEEAAKIKRDLGKFVRASVHWHKEKSPRF